MHFEQIRALFVDALAGKARNKGPPLRVFAASGEGTLKRLLPEEPDADLTPDGSE